MLVRLLPDQIAEYWELLEHAIEVALPPVVGESPDKMKHILENLLTGKMDCWASFKVENKNIAIDGAMATMIVEDQMSGTRDLLIYSVYGIQDIARGSWAAGYETIKKWAKGNKCGRIVGYTSVPSVITAVKRLGGDASQTYITLPVE